MEKQKVLIIDDDHNLRKSLSDILQLKGYETLAAESGREGLELLRQSSAAVVVIDLGLPDMSGLDGLETVNIADHHAESIILTGNASLDSAIEAANRGVFSYLLKPYDTDQVMFHIRRACETYHAREAIAEHGVELEIVNAQLREVNNELTAEIAVRKRAEQEREELIIELRDAMSKVKALSGLLPICMICKKIHNDEGYWEQLEIYIRDRSEADFSHGMCPECMKKLYPQYCRE